MANRNTRATTPATTATPGTPSQLATAAAPGTQAMQAIVQGAAAQAVALAVTPPSQPPVWANAPYAASLPKHLRGMGNNLLAPTKGANLAAVYMLGGVVAKPVSAGNVAWWSACLATLRANGGFATYAQLVAGGCGGHSIRAYQKRGWLALAPYKAAAPTQG